MLPCDSLILLNGALILDNEDEIKAREDGALKVNIFLCCLQVVVSADKQEVKSVPFGISVSQCSKWILRLLIL